MIKDSEVRILMSCNNILDDYLKREEGMVGRSDKDSENFALFCKARLIQQTITDMCQILEAKGLYKFEGTNS